MTRARILPTFLPALVLLAGVSLAQAQPLGQTSFANSGAAAAQEPFLRGLLLLHSFEYDDAREAFQEAARLDPGFAMAYWGEAMTHNHPVWFQQDREAARAALDRLAPTPEARLAKAPTEREKDYLRAADVLFGEGEKDARDDAFAEAMRRLSETYPDDLDAAAFYALSLLGTSHEGRDFATYMRAAATVEEVFARNPNHPGAAHYLIHSYDDPIHAPLGLRAARVYAKIAPAAAHALHMPSHIFVALGLWDDVVALNEASWAASLERIERKNLSKDQRGYHALWWLAYGYLQQGRYRDAQSLLNVVAQDHQELDIGRTRYHLLAMRAAYLVDTGQWDGPAAHIEIDPASLGLEHAATVWFVDGLGALNTGDRAAADAALAALRERRAAATEPQAQEIAGILENELAALLLLEDGQPDAALALLDQAAAAEDALHFDFGPPSPVKPAHELYGEVLLRLDRPAEAQAHFRKALTRTPMRAAALLGLARAAAQAGDEAAAQQTYDALRQIWHRADEDVPGLQEVRSMLGEARTKVE